MKNNKSDQLLIDSMSIQKEEAINAGTLGYVTRSMIMATLPHGQTNAVIYERKNGPFTLNVISKDGVPFGNIPRLLLTYITTEAIRTQSPIINFGNSMTSFLQKIGLQSTGGVNGSNTRLRLQSKKLYNSLISVSYSDDSNDKTSNFVITDESDLWWSTKNSIKNEEFRSLLTLSDKFFRDTIENPVPIDLRAVTALKGSSLALDIYTWGTYRNYALSNPTLISWAYLRLQFGSDYKDDKFGRQNFKRCFLIQLKNVMCIYPKWKVHCDNKGLTIYPSPTHIQQKKSVIRYKK
jgi:hypothetical protein